MINSVSFTEYVKRTFSFLITEFKLELGEITINGSAFYGVEYRDKLKGISISIEPIGEYFQVIVYKLDHGKMPDYDNKTKKIHLNELNKRVIKNLDKDEFNKNNQYFRDFETRNKTERMILKSAKDLRLVLSHYYD